MLSAWTWIGQQLHKLFGAFNEPDHRSSPDATAVNMRTTAVVTIILLARFFIDLLLIALLDRARMRLRIAGSPDFGNKARLKFS
jgi:hypothetical protein